MSSVERARKEHEAFLQNQVDRYAAGVDNLSTNLFTCVQKIWAFDRDWVREKFPHLIEDSWEDLPMGNMKVMVDGVEVIDNNEGPEHG